MHQIGQHGHNVHEPQELYAVLPLLFPLPQACRGCALFDRAEPGAILPLLSVARKHAVESCVDACLQLLLAQVG